MKIDTDLKMELEPAYEDRVTFWKGLFEMIPPLWHMKTSPTWKNPKLYKDILKEETSNSKAEL